MDFTSFFDSFGFECFLCTINFEFASRCVIDSIAADERLIFGAYVQNNKIYNIYYWYLVFAPNVINCKKLQLKTMHNGNRYCENVKETTIPPG